MFSLLHLAAAKLTMPGYLAAALGYTAGLVAHYVLSVRYVFAFRRMLSQRRREALIYALTGLIGVLLSAGIVRVGELIGQSLAVSKLAAIGASFIAVFMIRKITLFSVGSRAAQSAL